MKTSPARRVYDVLQRANGIARDKDAPSMIVWAAAFGVPELDLERGALSPAQESETLSLIGELRSEVDAVQASIAGTELAEAFAPVADSTRYLTATPQLVQNWSNSRANHLRPETLGAWQIISLTLPAADDQVDASALAALQADLEELEATVRNPSVPDDLRRLVQKQVRQIRRALRQYGVRGIEPLRDAISVAAGDLRRDQEALRTSASDAPAETTKVAQAMKKVWTTAVTACGDFDKLSKGYHVAADIVQKLLPALQKLAE